MRKISFFALLLSSTPAFTQTTPPTPPVYSETMEVAAIRADADVPVTRTDVAREEIEERYHGQDVPLLLRDAPSITAHSESGVGGAGYSYISLRGIGATRINFTLDGVPLADSEDMGTFFVDFPDLARSLQSIQIQRGVGTSTFGSASFGGSVNLESIDLAPEQSVQATIGGGSYGNRQVSVGYQSGALAGGFAFYTRLSFLENGGFRDNAATRQRNVFFSGSKPVGQGLLKLTGFSGHERQQLSFYATDEETLRVDPRANPLREEERDSFGYDLAQLQYILPLSSDSDMAVSGYYQRGYGWYRLFDGGTDVLRQYGLDGMLLGSILTYERRSGAVKMNYGLHLNRFQRDHTRDVVDTGMRDYANDGVKGEANAFAKLHYATGRWSLYGDLQLRHASFEYHGSEEVGGIGWTFINPKAGARYALTPASSVYGSVGMTTREPTRNDLFQGEDNPSVRHDLRAVKPEQVLNLELGWAWSRANLEVETTAYAMEFRNEIASTGELSEIGLLLRRNVDRSHRRGVEVDASWQVRPSLRSRTTATLSHNRIDSWTQFFDVYDAEGNYAGAKPATYRDVQPLLTPAVLITQSLDALPLKRLALGVTGRYVGRSYLDNTNDEAFAAPSHFVLDGRASYEVASWARVTLQVNNLFDADRVHPSGYSYRFLAEDVPSGTAYYYPQAGRNAVVLLDFGF